MNLFRNPYYYIARKKFRLIPTSIMYTYVMYDRPFGEKKKEENTKGL